jgi:hypothetical protein
MSVSSNLATPRPKSKIFTTIVLLAICWNVFGAFQFFNTAFASESELLAQGLSAEQAKLMAALPFWMDAAFAIGVLGALVGSVMLWFRQPRAVMVLLVSLLAYVVLFVGDWWLGVFSLFGAPQVIILTIVVVIALSLWRFAAVALRV